VPKATISKSVLNTLIRAKLDKLKICDGVRPSGVHWQERDRAGNNWTIPAWEGESAVVQRCTEEMREYLRFLGEQFDIPDDA